MGRHVQSHRILSSQYVREAVRPILSAPPLPLAGPSRPVLQDGSAAGPASDGDRANGSPDGADVATSADDIVDYTLETLPADLKKYYNKRHELFSRYDEGIQMDREGWWSVTPEDVAVHIAERCRCDTIVDAFCGVGGNAIQFAFTCERVIAIDHNPVRLACARHNARIYGVDDRIDFVCADFIDWARHRRRTDAVDVVFLSPPWGGIDYRGPPRKRPRLSKVGVPILAPIDADDGGEAATPSPFDLSTLQPIPADQLLRLVRSLTPEVAIYLPRNCDPAELAALYPSEPVEVEKQFSGPRFKAVTAYFGALVHPFDDGGGGGGVDGEG